MNEDLIKGLEEAFANGSQESYISGLKFFGYTDDDINSAVSSFKKKREDSGVSVSPSEDEYFLLDISENKPRGSSVKLFNAIAKGNMTASEIQKDPEYYDGLYSIYKAFNSDPSVAELPSSLFTESGGIDEQAFSRVKRDAYRNVQYQIEKDRKDYQEREGKIKERQESYVSVVSPIINGAESILGGVVKFAGEVSGSEPVTELGNYLLEDVELSSIAGMRNSGLTDEQIGKGFLQNMMDGDVGAGLSILGPTLLQQVPQLALIAATGGAAGITTLGVSSAGSALREVEDRQDMTSQEKMLYGIGSGIVEGLSERIFAGDIRALRQALGRSGLKDLTASEFKDQLFSAVPAGVRATFEEGFEEAIASAAQQTLLNAMTGDEIDPIEITEGAIIGTLMGGGTYLASRGIGAVMTPEKEKEKRKLNNEIATLKDKEQDPNLPQEDKDILAEEREKKQEKLYDLRLEADEVVKLMPEKDLRKFLELHKDLRMTIQSMRRLEDEDALKIQKAKANTLYEEAQKIYSKYDSQKEAGVPSPVVEGAPTVAAQPEQVPSPEAPEAGGILQVPTEERPEATKPQEVTREGNDLILRHGSPYEFDQFLLENIGTGEGQQAFGYGLYFTESSDIAKNYAKRLSEDKTGVVYTVRVKDGATKNWIEFREPITDGYLDKIQLNDEEIGAYMDYVNNFDFGKKDAPEHFGILGDFISESETTGNGVEWENVPTFAAILDLQDALGKERTMEILKRSGYDGISYNSKGGYGDAKNFVVFDPTSIEIIETSTGKIVPAVGGAPAAKPTAPEVKREKTNESIKKSVLSYVSDFREEKSKIWNAYKESNDFKEESAATKEIESRLVKNIEGLFEVGDKVTFSTLLQKSTLSDLKKDKEINLTLEFYDVDGKKEFSLSENGAPKGRSESGRAKRGDGFTAKFLNDVGWRLGLMGYSPYINVNLEGAVAPEVSKEDQDIKGLILKSFKNKAFPIIPSIRLRNGEYAAKIPIEITEEELTSALDNGNVPTNQGIIKISDIESVSGDGAIVSRTKKAEAPEAKPAKEKAPAEKPAPQKKETPQNIDELKSSVAGWEEKESRDFIEDFIALFNPGDIVEFTLKVPILGKSGRPLKGKFQEVSPAIRISDDGKNASLTANFAEGKFKLDTSERNKNGTIKSLVSGQLAGSIKRYLENETTKLRVISKGERVDFKKVETPFVGSKFVSKDGNINYSVDGGFVSETGKVMYTVRSVDSGNTFQISEEELKKNIDNGTFAKPKVNIGGTYIGPSLKGTEYEGLGFSEGDVYLISSPIKSKSKRPHQRGDEPVYRVKNITKDVYTEFVEHFILENLVPSDNKVTFNAGTGKYEVIEKKTPSWLKFKDEKNQKGVYTTVGGILDSFPILSEKNEFFDISKYPREDRIQAKSIRALISGVVQYSSKSKTSVEKATERLLALEEILAEMNKYEDARDATSTKANVVEKIRKSKGYSKEQKEILIDIVNQLKSENIFNFLLPSEKMDKLGKNAIGGYRFNGNFLKAKNPEIFVHEIGHWGYYNLLTAKERAEFIEYAATRFNGDVGGARQLAETVVPKLKFKDGKTLTLASNAANNYQEYFANQFQQWFYNEKLAPDQIKTLYQKLVDFIDYILGLYKEKGYNPDLVKYFERIVEQKKTQSEIDVLEKADPLEQTTEYDEEGASKASGKDSNVRFNGKKSLRERAINLWFSNSWSKEQKFVRMFKDDMTSQVNNERRKILLQSKNLDSLLENKDEETIELVRLLMTGNMDGDMLKKLMLKPDGKEIATMASAMRAYVDSFADDFISNPAFYKLPAQTAMSIIDNMGSYMRNSYRFWKDNRYEPSRQAIDAAVEYEFEVLQTRRGEEVSKLFDIEQTQLELNELRGDLAITVESIRIIEDQIAAGDITQDEFKKELNQLRESQKSFEEQISKKSKLASAQSKLFNELMEGAPMNAANLAEFEAKREDYMNEVLAKESPDILKKAEESIQSYLDDIQKIRTSERFKKLGEISPSSIKLPSQEFRQRKDLPETIQNLLGKEKDPVVMFSDTANALASIKYKGHMLYAISESLGGEEKFIKNDATEAEKTSGEFRLVTDKFSPLNGRYVHKDVFEALVDPKIYEGTQWWSDAYFSILLAARKSKVLYNIPTWRKNLTGGWYTIMANGVMDPNFIKNMQRRAEMMIKGETDPEWETLIDVAAANGLMNQSVNANLMGFIDVMYTRASKEDDYRTAFQKASDLIKGFDQKAGSLYASVDDHTKLVIFQSELKSQAMKLYGEEYSSLKGSQKKAVERAAAEVVKSTTPTFSKLPRWYSKIAVLPLGDFVSFELEALRSFGMNIAYGAADIAKALKDKELSASQKSAYIKAGAARLSGSAAIAAFRLSIVGALAAAALGDDDEIEEDIKNIRPNWMEGHSIIPVNITEDGIATVYDYSMEDPYGSFFDLVNDPLSFPEYVQDLLGLNMGVTYLVRLAENKDMYGRDIVESYDGPMTKAYKYTNHTLKSLIVPPFVSSAIRDERRRGEIEAEKYDRLDALGRFVSRAFVRDYQYNIGVQFYYFSEQFGTKKVQYTDLTGAARENRLAELAEIKKMYDSIANIAIQKGNMSLLTDARNNVKRKYKAAEEAYILSGYEVPEE